MYEPDTVRDEKYGGKKQSLGKQKLISPYQMC